MTAEAILAAVLLVSPPAPPLSESHHVWLDALRPSLLALAIDAEILDPREKGFVMAYDPAGDLTMLQGRARGMLSAPHMGECDRLPDRKQINDLLALNRIYRNHLQARLAVDLLHAEVLRNAICETDRLYQIWDAARDSSCEYYYVTVRRHALQLLRDLIGPEAFYSGQMPPHVPVRHLPQR